MSRHVLPHPPSPTTTNFFENDGGCVIFVAAETRSVEVFALALVPTVPSLYLVLCCLTGLTGFLRGDIEPGCASRAPLLLEPRRKKS